MNFIAKSIAVFMMATLPGLGSAESWKQVRKEVDFVKILAGKTVTWPGGTGVLNVDGTTNGTLKDGSEYYGNWVWNGRFYCRNLVIGGKARGTNCAKVEVSGNQVRLSNDKGRGRVTVLTLN